MAIFRRFYSILAFRRASVRTPLLEELLEAPVLKTEEMGADFVADMKGFRPKTSIQQIEASLCHEFNRHIMATDWSQYTDPVARQDRIQSVRLLHFTLAVCSSNSKKADSHLAKDNIKWITKEIELLEKEASSGNYSRWETERHTELEQLEPQQHKPALIAAQILARNPHLHPHVKNQILGEIIKLLKTTIK